MKKIQIFREVKEHNSHALSSHRQEIITMDVIIYSLKKSRL